MPKVVRLLALLATLLLPVVAMAPASWAADTAPKASPFAGAAGKAITSAPPAREAGIWGWIMEQQARINRELAGAVRNLKSGDTLSATLVLAFLSFSYGVLHAIGPGHGKAVISSYVLANERTVRRGIYLSFLAAFFQAISALAIVGVLAILLKATSLQMKAAEGWIETVSWALVAAVGAWLLYRNLAAAFAPKRPPQPAQAHHDHDHEHHSHDRRGHQGHGHGHAHHDAHDGHDHSACCGHAHMPEPHQLEGELTWKKAFAIAFAVGIRPCTGAILVLIFALSQGLLWAGVFATFAMALGTAITVSALAALAVGSRELATRMAGREGGWGQRVETGVGIAGSALVFLMGAVFFIGSLQGPSPF